MLVNIFLLALGLTLLVVGADFLVEGASRIARNYKVPPLIIGLTIVSFGTSLPETASSVSAALSGHTDLALGNIVGSNIYNLLLILGIAASIAPLVVSSQLIKQEMPIMIATTLLLIFMIADGVLSNYDAAILFFLSILYTVVLIYLARRSMLAISGTAVHTELQVQSSRSDNTDVGRLLFVPAPMLIIAGLIMLTLGGHWLVSSAIFIASVFGVSDLVIGLTVVAIGTSIPEVATCVLAVLRDQRDLAVGNVVGSNIFNILICLGLSGMVADGGLNAPSALLNFDIWVMLAVACVTLPIIISGSKVSRSEGFILLLFCACYIGYSLLNAAHHDALPAYSFVMLLFVVPLTLMVVFLAIFD